ncbi:HD-GYP domain-containing protein [Methylobacterium sp. ID0610]|uniref:HD-GYP domain-containing protein n=1 Tax=Methylobacterium carpenticola TaxID=3344827 RepID=UPI0036B25AE3
MRDEFILLITDRASEISDLAAAFARLLPCIALLPGEGLPLGRCRAVVLDLAPGNPSAMAGILSAVTGMRARGTPCLCLARDLRPHSIAQAQALGASQVLPASTPIADLVTALLTLLRIDAMARAAEPLRAVRDQAVEAKARVTRIFRAATEGEALSQDDVETGTRIILDAMADSGIRVWLDTIWAHEIGVYQHSLGVAGYACAFAVQLGFRRRDQERLVRAALLHDIGKARIPRAILNKPAALSGEEMAVMRAHPAIGAELLADQGGFDPEILDVVRHHHEMLDGSGYPDGLRGAQISDIVRLATICDIYSALTERRPYRAPMAAAEAWAVMERMGPKLDRPLLAAFRPIAASLAADDL